MNEVDDGDRLVMRCSSNRCSKGGVPFSGRRTALVCGEAWLALCSRILTQTPISYSSKTKGGSCIHAEIKPCFVSLKFAEIQEVACGRPGDAGGVIEKSFTIFLDFYGMGDILCAEI